MDRRALLADEQASLHQPGAVPDYLGRLAGRRDAMITALLYWAGLAVSLASVVAINAIPNPPSELIIPAVAGVFVAAASRIWELDLERP